MSHARLIAVAAGALLAAACSQTQPEVKTDAAAAKPADTHHEMAQAKTAEVKKEAAEAGEVELPVREVAAEMKTPLLDAIRAAIAHSHGQAVEAGLEGEMEHGNRSVFVEVMVLAANGDAIEVKVDPATGKVLSAAKSDESDEAGELAGVLKKLPSGHLSLGDLVKMAGAAGEGQMIAAGFAVNKEHAAVGVVRFLVGKELHQVTLDPKTAAVLTKKTLTEEDEDEDEDDEKDEKHEGMEKK
jgi:uncharacterized membrane protein YkoI